MITLFCWLLAILAIILGLIVFCTIGGAALGILGVLLFLVLDILVASAPLIIVMSIRDHIKKKKESEEAED